MAALSEGFDLQAPGVTLPAISQVFRLSGGNDLMSGFVSPKSLFLSISTFGLLVGSPAGGWLADRFGRKWVAICSIISFGLFSMLTARAGSVEMLLMMRFVTGVGLGGALPALMAIVSEVVEPKYRSTAVGVLYSSMPVGGVLVSLVSIAYSNVQQWSVIYNIGGLLPIAAAVGMMIVLPNSRPVRRVASKGDSRPSAIFGKGLSPSTLSLWLGYAAVMAGSYMMLSWLPSLLLSKGLEPSRVFVVQMAFTGFGVVGSVVTGALLDRFLPLVVIGLTHLATLAAMIMLASVSRDFVPVLLICGAAGWLISGASVILYALVVQCYADAARGRGVGYAVASGRVGSAIGPLIAGGMLGGGLGASGVLAALIPLMLVGGAASIFVAFQLNRRAG